MTNQLPTHRELRALQVFLETASVTETARILGVSQPAISKALKQLEVQLGFQLFERMSGRLIATKETMAMAPSIDRVFASLAALTAEARLVRHQQIGRLVVGALPTLAHVCVPRTLDAVLKRYPGLNVSIEILPTVQIVEGVSRGSMEIGLAHDVSSDPSLEIEDLGTASMCCAVPIGHPFCNRSSISLQEVSSLPFVSFPPDSPIGRRLSAAFKQEKSEFAPAIAVNASTTLCTLAARSGIIGVVEDYVLSLGWWPSLRAVRLEPAIAIRARILTRRQSPLSLAAKAFCQEYRRVIADVIAASGKDHNSEGQRRESSSSETQAASRYGGRVRAKKTKRAS